MPTVKRFPRCRIEMYFGDHNPPHFHVITVDEERIAVVIQTLDIMAGTARQRDVVAAMAWARAHQSELMARWKLYSEVE